MIRHLAPQIIKTPTTWDVIIALDLQWLESVKLTKKDLGTTWVNRTMNAKLSFRLIIKRFVDVNSTIFIKEVTILWAYVSKSYIIIDNQPRMVLEITTHTKLDGTMIDPTSFYVVNHIGALILDVTNLTLVKNETADGAMQKWMFTVFVDGSLCTTSINDNFTISFTLISASSAFSYPPYSGVLTLTLAQMENWCTVNQTLGLAAVSNTYGDSTYLLQSAMFFTNDIVYVMVDSIPDANLELSMTILEAVKVSGAAVPAPSTPINLYNSADGTIVAPASTLAWSCAVPAILPPICNYPNRTCYHFTLPANLLVNRPLTITSTIRIVLADPLNEKRRSVTMDKTMTYTRVSIKQPEMKQQQTPITQTETTSLNKEKVVLTVSYQFSSILVGVAVVIPVLSVIGAIIYAIKLNRRV
jgi:hypothetical protein